MTYTPIQQSIIDKIITMNEEETRAVIELRALTNTHPDSSVKDKQHQEWIDGQLELHLLLDV